MGHLENYSWVNALLALFFLYGTKYLKGRYKLVYAVIAWILACYMHMLAIFYFPALIYLIFKPQLISDINSNKKLKIEFVLPSRKEIETVLSLLIIFLLLITLAPLFMKSRVMMLDVTSLRLVPLFKISNPRHYFTMFSLEHFKMMFYFIHQASLFGIPLLILLFYKIRSNFHIFIFIGFLSGLLWAFIWHPDMGYGDWDLFGSFAIPLNILNGLLLSEKIPFPKFEKTIKKILFS